MNGYLYLRAPPARSGSEVRRRRKRVRKFSHPQVVADSVVDHLVDIIKWIYCHAQIIFPASYMKTGSTSHVAGTTAHDQEHVCSCPAARLS